MSIEALKEQIKRLDAERLRIFKEAEKRKRDLKLNMSSLSEQLIGSERQKINNLEDILEDIEYDLTTCLDELFSIADKDTEFEQYNKEFKSMLENKLYDDAKEQTLSERRDLVSLDLEIYKAAYANKKAELEELADLIEATEQELDEIIAELAGNI